MDYALDGPDGHGGLPSSFIGRVESTICPRRAMWTPTNR
jgi:hypothetical protein